MPYADHAPSHGYICQIAIGPTLVRVSESKCRFGETLCLLLTTLIERKENLSHGSQECQAMIESGCPTCTIMPSHDELASMLRFPGRRLPQGSPEAGAHQDRLEDIFPIHTLLPVMMDEHGQPAVLGVD